MGKHESIDDDRRAELESFANGNAPQVLPPTAVRPLSGPADRVFGAQAVAVYRDDARVLQKIKALAAAAGSDWYYRFPVNSKGGKQWVEGPSIKLANDVARIYGNCDVDVRAIDKGDSWEFYARFTDFESGYSLTRPFQQRKSQSAMKGDADRALDIAYQIGVSKAIRNVVVNALQTYADYAFEEAYNSLVTKIGSDIDAWRNRTVEGIAKIPVDLVRVEAVVGRAAKDWLAPDVARVIAMMKSIADGMATVDETFPPLGKKPAGDEGEGETRTVQGFADKNAKTESTSTQENMGPASGQPASETDAPEQGEGQEAGEASPPKGGKGGGKAAKAATEKDDDGEKTPTNAKEYYAYADKWIDEIEYTDATKAGTKAIAEKRWKDEKDLRNKLNLDTELRDELKRKLDGSF